MIARAGAGAGAGADVGQVQSAGQGAVGVSSVGCARAASEPPLAWLVHTCIQREH
jgi:hypothetical protein